MKKELSIEELQLQHEELVNRLEEAEQLIEAIKAGEVDAFALRRNNQSQIFTLESGDYGYRMLVENITEGALTLSEECLIVYTNNYFHQLLGVPYEQVIGKPIFNFIHPASKETFSELFKKGLAGQSRGEINLTAANKIITVYVSLTSLYPTLQTVGMIVTDLTEKKKQDKILEQHKELEIEKRLLEESGKAIRQVMEFDEAIMTNMGEGLYTVDINGRVTTMNPAAEKLFGWKKEELLGKKMHDIAHYKHRDGSPFPAHECAGLQVLTKDITLNNYEDVFIKKDGTFFDVMYSSSPIVRNGKKEGLIVVFRDITGQKEAARKLNESREQLRQLTVSLEEKVKRRTAEIEKKNAALEKMNAELQQAGKILLQSEERYHRMVSEVQDYAIILLNNEGIIQNWNKGAENIKGYKEEEIIGEHFRIFYREDDREKKLPEQLISEAKEKGSARHEGWRVRKNGTIFWGSMVITALHDDYHNIIGFSKVTRDLTEKKLAEDQLKQYAKDLEFQNKELEQYAYIASHDLQEPLRKIQTFAELLEKNIDDKSAVKRNLEKITSSAKRTVILIKDILKYSQLSQTDGVMTAIDLSKVLEEVKEDFDLLIEQKQAKIIHSELPVIKGIRIQLYQLFSNLIGNSIKFNNKVPVIEITSEKIFNGEAKKYTQLNSNCDYIKILFKDNGIGFEPEYSEQIFGLFKRLSNTKYGTGIGLALCKKIVENHRGHISVSSELNKGTTFNIFLPAS